MKVTKMERGEVEFRDVGPRDPSKTKAINYNPFAKAPTIVLAIEHFDSGTNPDNRPA